ncbi:MAG: hypothetical protein LBU62_01830 [Bacteroidales bacterium]|jgi:hypothetical protein|nr:hypothetical protein [Bacteroidales bacterium]
MRTLKCLLVAGIVLSIISCNKNQNVVDKKEGLSVMLVKSTTGSGLKIPEKELIFTGDDIISFNLSTSEIIFTNEGDKKLSSFSFNGASATLNFYLNGEPLFESAIYTAAAYSSFLINDLVLYYSVDSKYYLSNGYPEIADEWLDADDVRKIREDNAQKRKIGWDTFIGHLSKINKIVK